MGGVGKEGAEGEREAQATGPGDRRLLTLDWRLGIIRTSNISVLLD